MSADNLNQNPPQTTPPDEKSKGNQDALNSQLAEVQEQLRAMNASMAATQQAIADANRKQTPPPERNLYDPEQLLQAANEAADRKYREEREKDIKIFNLAQDYPEIQTDAKVRQAVLDAQKEIPESFRNTAYGYEMAVLKATSRAGLIPKSKRQTLEDDVSIRPGTGTAGDRPRSSRGKVAIETLAAAEAMGINIEDPEVLKRLESHSTRDYSKYR